MRFLLFPCHIGSGYNPKTQCATIVRPFKPSPDDKDACRLRRLPFIVDEPAVAVIVRKHHREALAVEPSPGRMKQHLLWCSSIATLIIQMPHNDSFKTANNSIVTFYSLMASCSLMAKNYALRTNI
jgi:hypothetical protein